jgi:RecG-like helicase
MQSGFPNLIFADLTTDQEILIRAKNDAFNIVGNDSKIELRENYMIKNKLKEYYSENLKYSLIG